jgi:hypothetical protein
MASDGDTARWLDLLVEQTGFGNIDWDEIVKGNSYSCTTASGIVVLETRDGDGELPFTLAVALPDGRVTDRWVVWGHFDNPARTPGDAAPEWLSSRVRLLWETVQKQFLQDPIQLMLSELQQLPPF